MGEAPAGMADRLAVLMRRQAEAPCDSSDDEASERCAPAQAAPGPAAGADAAAADAGGGGEWRPRQQQGSLPPDLLRRLQQVRSRGPGLGSPPEEPAGAASAAGVTGAAAVGPPLRAGVVGSGGSGGEELRTPEDFVARLRDMILRGDADAGDSEEGSDERDAGAAGGAGEGVPPDVAARLLELRARQGGGGADAPPAQQQQQWQQQQARGSPGAAGAGVAAEFGTAGAAGAAGGLLARALALASRSLQQQQWRECRERAAACIKIDGSSKVGRSSNFAFCIAPPHRAPRTASALGFGPPRSRRL